MWGSLHREDKSGEQGEDRPGVAGLFYSQFALLWSPRVVEIVGCCVYCHIVSTALFTFPIGTTMTVLY
ncbi:hypothetical protein Q1695_003917 [Nippostrongylus brasiliensis]|nr:hypothetical protein Q1695_003917 [Nippostrongylus brasiliensis]